MKTCWNVRITFELAMTEDPVCARYPLFETYEAAIAALRKATGVTIPFKDDGDGVKSWDYDRDGGPFVPGVSLITINSLEIDESGEGLLRHVPMMIRIACDQDEAALRKNDEL